MSPVHSGATGPTIAECDAAFPNFAHKIAEVPRPAAKATDGGPPEPPRTTLPKDTAGHIDLHGLTAMSDDIAEARPADLPSSPDASPDSAARDSSGSDGHTSEAGGDATVGSGSFPQRPDPVPPSSPLDRPFIVVRKTVGTRRWFFIVEVDGPSHEPTIIAETSYGTQAYRICAALNEQYAASGGSKSFVRPEPLLMHTRGGAT
jgi:hypothetical protein